MTVRLSKAKGKSWPWKLKTKVMTGLLNNMMTQEQLPLKIEGLDAYQAKLMSSSPDWLKNLRRKGAEKFISLGLPTVKEEDWKYTSLAELSSKNLQIPSVHKLAEESQFNAYID